LNDVVICASILQVVSGQTQCHCGWLIAWRGQDAPAVMENAYHQLRFAAVN